MELPNFRCHLKKVNMPCLEMLWQVCCVEVLPFWMALRLIQIDELEQIFDEVALVGEKLSFCQRISQNDYNI